MQEKLKEFRTGWSKEELKLLHPALFSLQLLKHSMQSKIKLLLHKPMRKLLQEAIQLNCFQKSKTSKCKSPCILQQADFQLNLMWSFHQLKILNPILPPKYSPALQKHRLLQEGQSR